jgi:tetratricopeptide (TPR) repeat protein
VRMHLVDGDLRAAEQTAGGELLKPISIPYARYTIFVCLANIELVIARGNYQEGLELANDLLNEVQPLTRTDIPDVLRWKGDALLGLGHIDEAQRTLQEARSLAEGLGARMQLWQILASLALADGALGSHAHARTDRGRARELVNQIAESLHGISLTEAFLRQRAVAALMR